MVLMIIKSSFPRIYTIKSNSNFESYLILLLILNHYSHCHKLLSIKQPLPLPPELLELDADVEFKGCGY